jgi:serine/threonine protein phosphatase 1
MLSKLLRPRVAPAPRLPPGERVYAIGDVHGRSDCLDRLIAMIDKDDALRGAPAATLVFLGDLIDRGSDSRGVIERLASLAHGRPCVLIMGNHEEVLLNAWEGDPAAARLFVRVGGIATLASYGADPAGLDAAPADAIIDAIRTHVPVDHAAFLRGFVDRYRLGDYLFVHAGIKPGVALDDQSPTDMRWIRDRFLADTRDHGVFVVHGHSISPGVDEQLNRIGIDTGAYASSKLTALGIEGTERWYLST